MKPFLILQLRPEAEAADDEFQAFLEKGGLAADEVHRIRLDQEDLPATINLDDYSGTIVGGGPGCVSDDPATKDPVEARIEAAVLSLLPEITERDLPFMGCCYGLGALAHHLGAEVSKKRYGEDIGPVECTLTDAGRADPLFDGLPDVFPALVGHKEAVQHLPEGAVHLVASDPCPFQMIRHGQNVYATQFHPEADGDGFATRIRIYRNHGYFHPKEAGALTERAQSVTIDTPPKLLARFVQRYRSA